MDAQEFGIWSQRFDFQNFFFLLDVSHTTLWDFLSSLKAEEESLRSTREISEYPQKPSEHIPVHNNLLEELQAWGLCPRVNGSLFEVVADQLQRRVSTSFHPWVLRKKAYKWLTKNPEFVIENTEKNEEEEVSEQPEKRKKSPRYFVIGEQNTDERRDVPSDTVNSDQVERVSLAPSSSPSPSPSPSPSHSHQKKSARTSITLEQWLLATQKISWEKYLEQIEVEEPKKKNKILDIFHLHSKHSDKEKNKEHNEIGSSSAEPDKHHHHHHHHSDEEDKDKSKKITQEEKNIQLERSQHFKGDLLNIIALSQKLYVQVLLWVADFESSPIFFYPKNVRSSHIQMTLFLNSSGVFSSLVTAHIQKSLQTRGMLREPEPLEILHQFPSTETKLSTIENVEVKSIPGKGKEMYFLRRTRVNMHVSQDSLYFTTYESSIQIPLDFIWLDLSVHQLNGGGKITGELNEQTLEQIMILVLDRRTCVMVTPYASFHIRHPTLDVTIPIACAIKKKGTVRYLWMRYPSVSGYEKPTYAGNIANGLREGFGDLHLPDMYSYSGNWHLDNFHGFGTLKILNSDLKTFNGLWETGYPVKSGTITNKKGDRYYGDVFAFTDNPLKVIRHGLGIQKYATGDTFVGSWKYDNQEGFGKLEMSSGEIFEGDWKNNQLIGIAIHHDSSCSFVGKFTQKKGRSGHLMYNNGDIFIGNWDSYEEGREIFAGTRVRLGKLLSDPKSKLYQELQEIIQPQTHSPIFEAACVEETCVLLTKVTQLILEHLQVSHQQGITSEIGDFFRHRSLKWLKDPTKADESRFLLLHFPLNLFVHEKIFPLFFDSVFSNYVKNHIAIRRDLLAWKKTKPDLIDLDLSSDSIMIDDLSDSRVRKSIELLNGMTSFRSLYSKFNCLHQIFHLLQDAYIPLKQMSEILVTYSSLRNIYCEAKFMIDFMPTLPVFEHPVYLELKEKLKLSEGLLGHDAEGEVIGLCNSIISFIESICSPINNNSNKLHVNQLRQELKSDYFTSLSQWEIEFYIPQFCELILNLGSVLSAALQSFLEQHTSHIHFAVKFYLLLNTSLAFRVNPIYSLRRQVNLSTEKKQFSDQMLAHVKQKWIELGANNRRSQVFSNQMRLIESLDNLPSAFKKNSLHQEINQINQLIIRSLATYVPISYSTDIFHVVVYCPADKAHVFSSKTAPVLLLMEIITLKDKSFSDTEEIPDPLLVQIKGCFQKMDSGHDSRESAGAHGAVKENEIGNDGGASADKEASKEAGSGKEDKEAGTGGKEDKKDKEAGQEAGSGQEADRVRIWPLEELWTEKKQMLQKKSIFGDISGWDCIQMIIKEDDCRTEALAMQFIIKFDLLFKASNISMWLRPYQILLSSPRTAHIEILTDVVCFDDLRRHCGTKNIRSLKQFFEYRYGDESGSSFQTARKNFVQSLASYNMVSYLLDLKDRHEGNIMLDTEGHLIHIDFGHVLGSTAAAREPPFKFTSEFVELMGDLREYHDTLFLTGFLTLREHSNEIFYLLQSDVFQSLTLDRSGFQDRFKLEMNDAEVKNYIRELVDYCINNPPHMTDVVHRLGVFFKSH